MFRPVSCLALIAALLSGCDALGIDSPEKIAAGREAEGKAVGGACRHAGRAIEDCYTMNKKADKAAVFAGWREMNDYMRENKIDPVAPAPVAEAAAAKPDAAAEARPAAQADGKAHAAKAKDKPKGHDS